MGAVIMPLVELFDEQKDGIWPDQRVVRVSRTGK
jgi:hypothetical protein